MDDWLSHIDLGTTVLVQTGRGPAPMILIGRGIPTLRTTPRVGDSVTIADHEVRNPIDGSVYWVLRDEFVRGTAPNGSFEFVDDPIIAWTDSLYDWTWLDNFHHGEPIWCNTIVGRVEMRYRGPLGSGRNRHWIEHPKTAVQYEVHRTLLTPKDNMLPLLPGKTATPMTAATEYGTDGVTTEQPEPRSVSRPPEPAEPGWSEDVVIGLLAQLQVCSSLLLMAAHMSAELGKPVMARVFENQVAAVDQTIEDVQGEM